MSREIKRALIGISIGLLVLTAIVAFITASPVYAARTGGDTTVQRASDDPARTRTALAITASSTDQLVHTTTEGKTLYITDILFTLENTGTTRAQVAFENGTTTSGTVVFPLIAASSTPVFLSLSEPLQFTDGLFLDVTAGTPTFAGTLLGYEE